MSRSTFAFVCPDCEHRGARHGFSLADRQLVACQLCDCVRRADAEWWSFGKAEFERRYGRFWVHDERRLEKQRDTTRRVADE
jgi:hypothetical protein